MSSSKNKAKIVNRIETLTLNVPDDDFDDKLDQISNKSHESVNCETDHCVQLNQNELRLTRISDDRTITNEKKAQWKIDPFRKSKR